MICGFLAACFAVAAALKLASGHDPAFSLSPSVYYLSAGVELVIAVVLLSSRSWLGLWATVGFALVAGTATLVWRDRDCGCLGHFAELAWRSRIVLLSVFGALAGAALHLRIENSVARGENAP